MFDPVEFYHLAATLHSPSSGQAALRSAVSRAYYAAFLCARENAKLNGSQGASIPEQVIKHFKAKKPTLANRLADLRIRRNNADYDLKKRVSVRDSGEALRLSKEIIKDLGLKITNAAP